MDRALPLALLAATIAFVLAWSARAPATTAHAWTPDELGHLVSGGFLDQLRDPETAVNPPVDGPTACWRRCPSPCSPSRSAPPQKARVYGLWAGVADTSTTRVLVATSNDHERIPSHTQRGWG